MTWTISPDTFDVVVIGSGLPECLVAASLVKAGKSVLIIDAVDTYGTDFASFTPAALQDALSQQQRQQQAASQKPAATTTPASAVDAVNPAAAIAAAAAADCSSAAASSPRDKEATDHEHSLPAEYSPVSEPLPPGCRLLRLRQRPLPVSDIRALAAAGEGGGPADRRGYILDLVPKLVYQGEPLVDLLVRCRCHHYLELRAVEGSYLLQDGALQGVPAGRADIFRDRRLSLADKRVLMRFIQGCVEARTGQGHLRDSLSSSRTLSEILAAEGLPPRLREVILYGIAMCDTDQEPPSAVAAAVTGAAAAAPAPAAIGGGGGGAASPAVMTGSEGGAALELFTGSQGRFGQEGAFMMPCYGSGSVAEAFVRLCAVYGAVTVLRQPVQALLVQEGQAKPAEAGVRLAEAGAKPPPEAEELVTAADPEAVQAEAEVEVVPAGEAGATVEGSASGEGCRLSGSGGAGACVGIVTATGQVVRCSTVVAGTSTLSCLEGVSSPSPAERVSRAVVVMDGPLLPATAAGSQLQPQSSGSPSAVKSLLTLVVPPRCPSTGAAAEVGAGSVAGGAWGAGACSGNPHPVRVIQQGASTCVCPAGRFLLYLSTPATSISAYDDLWPTLDLLTDTSDLCDVTCPSSSSAAAAATVSPPSTAAAAISIAPAAAAPVTSETSTTANPATADAEQQGSSSTAPGGPSTTSASAGSSAGSSSPPGAPRTSQPRALRAWFYRQPVLHRAASDRAVSGWQLPGGVVPLPGPDGALAGYSQVLTATEAAFRAAFPETKWLAEVDFTVQADGEAEEDGEGDGGGSGGGGAFRDEEDDAIDELTAAVARLKDV